MKFSVFYSGARDKTETIEAQDHRTAAQLFFSQHPVLEDRQITVDLQGWRNVRIEQFQATEFLDEATRAALLSAPSLPHPAPDPPIPGLAAVFRILATLEIIGGLVLCFALWPEAAREGYELRAVAYVSALTWLMAGVIFGCLFFAVAEVLIYLSQIRDSLAPKI
jgi:hypothetical protein